MEGKQGEKEQTAKLSSGHIYGGRAALVGTALPILCLLRQITLRHVPYFGIMNI